MLAEGDGRRWSAEGLAADRDPLSLGNGLVEEFHDLGLDDDVHLDVRGDEARSVLGAALVLAAVLASHVRDREHASVLVHAEAVRDREVLLREALGPGELWRRLAGTLADYVGVLALDHLDDRILEVLDRRSRVHLCVIRTINNSI